MKKADRLLEKPEFNPGLWMRSEKPDFNPRKYTQPARTNYSAAKNNYVVDWQLEEEVIKYEIPKF